VLSAVYGPENQEKRGEVGVADSMGEEKNEQRKSGEFFTPAEGKK
jgi:hypothetical protein